MKSGGNDYRPGGMPHLFVLSKVDLRASPSKDMLSSKLSTAPANTRSGFLLLSGISGRQCWSLLSSLLLL